MRANAVANLLTMLTIVAGTALPSQPAYGGDTTATVFAGLDMPLATAVYEQEYNAGFNVGFQVRHPIDGAFSVAAEFAYSRFGDEATGTELTVEDLNRLRLSGGILVGSNRERVLKPCIKLLAGIYHHSFDRGETDIVPPPPWMPTVANVEHGSKFGLNVGGGVTIAQGNRFGLYLGVDLDLIFQSNNLTDLTVKGGLTFPIRRQ